MPKPAQPGGPACPATDSASSEETLAARRLFFKGVLPGHKPTVTITLQTAPAIVRVAASRTQRIVV